MESIRKRNSLRRDKFKELNLTEKGANINACLTNIMCIKNIKKKNIAHVPTDIINLIERYASDRF